MSSFVAFVVKPEVDFTNFLLKAFAGADPKNAKKKLNCQSFLRLWDLCPKKLLVKC